MGNELALLKQNTISISEFLLKYADISDCINGTTRNFAEDLINAEVEEMDAVVRSACYLCKTNTQIVSNFVIHARLMAHTIIF